MDEVVIKPFSPASQATIVEEGKLPKMIIDVNADDVGYPIKSGYEPEFEEIDILASKPRPVSCDRFARPHLHSDCDIN